MMMDPAFQVPAWQHGGGVGGVGVGGGGGGWNHPCAPWLCTRSETFLYLNILSD